MNKRNAVAGDAISHMCLHLYEIQKIQKNWKTKDDKKARKIYENRTKIENLIAQIKAYPMNYEILQRITTISAKPVNNKFNKESKK